VSHKHLDRAEVLNLVYTGQADAMADAYARLKAEVERLNNESDILQKCCEHQKNRIERLKAEVERLDTLCKQVMSQHSDISCENIMLRKAGDAMASGLHGMAGERPKALADEWNDAKEGKQS
jgi:predicted RNase H-like nuclease (RuvC/YqgF family)